MELVLAFLAGAGLAYLALIARGHARDAASGGASEAARDGAEPSQANSGTQPTVDEPASPGEAPAWPGEAPAWPGEAPAPPRADPLQDEPSQPQPESQPSPQPSRSEASSSADSTAPLDRLHELAGPLESAGDASAHPADLMRDAAFQEACKLLGSEGVSTRQLVDYATGATWVLSAAAYAALRDRPDRNDVRDALVNHFRNLGPWPMYYALKCFESLDTRPELGELVLRGGEWWSGQPVVWGVLREHFAARRERGDAIGFGDALTGLTASEAQAAEELIAKIDDPAAAQLLEQLRAFRATSLDRSFLESFGRFHEPDDTELLLVEHDSIIEQLAIAQACATHRPARSVLAVAEPRGGKTAFLKLVAMRLREQGWVLFEAGPASLMSGQQYFGQLEERLRRLTAELAIEKRVLWYVPDLLQLATSGRHDAQTASILEQVFPAIAAGRIVVLSEATPSGLTKLLQLKPAVRTAFEIVRLRALGDGEIAELSKRVAARMHDVLGVQLPAESLDAANHLSRYYLGTSQMPGALIDLMKLGAQHAAAADRPRLERDDLLLVLSQMTGMPRSVLDDRERIELARMREFFAARVIGQPEAVAAVVDRIAMLKAGLTDPARPTAVFLFAGPTGTGKTELAKTLAAYLFGSAERLLRLDMSEYQSPDALHRLLGGAGFPADGDSFTQRIRKQPFSVVLLDEFEKAAPQVWDLFLQVFDDGRLTDASGNTADFRHSIIILTSNLGATMHQGARIGFASNASAFSAEQVQRAVGESFRPELVNRLDKVIVFRPLTRELMRDILKKELARVLERRGLRHREWAVEWESSALDFLLERGFSPEMGARPLKRAIDQYLLAPLAATMVEHRFPEGDQFLFVRSDGQSIQVEFVDPDAPVAGGAELPAGESRDALTLAHVMLQPAGTAEERDLLSNTLDTLAAELGSDRVESLRAKLSAEMSEPAFWNRDERHRTLARYALLDRLDAAFETARGLRSRLARSQPRGGRYSRDLLARLAGRLWVLRDGLEDVAAGAPIEVAVYLEPAMDAAGDRAAAQEWCERLARMYRSWAASRHMQLHDDGRADLFVVSGFGAARTMLAEAGLHVLEHGDAGVDRVVARVQVVETPLGVDGHALKRTALVAELRKAQAVAAIVRRYRLEPSPLVRDARAGWRTGRSDLVLEGHFDMMPEWLGTVNSR